MIVNVHRNLNWMNGAGFSILDRSFKLLDRKLWVVLQDCKFVVHPSGNKRAMQSGTRNVHAFVRGELLSSTNMVPVQKPAGVVEVSYNPFDERGFFTTDDNKEIWGADKVWFWEGKAWVR